MRIGAIAFAAAMLAIGAAYEYIGSNMPRGTLAYPGPGFFPTMIGVFLIATALGCLLQDVFSREKPAEPVASALPGGEPHAGEARHVMKTVQLVALLVAYGLVVKPLGFPLAICGFVAVAVRIFGYAKWLQTAAIAVVIAAVSYVSFVLWLKVPLPLGVLEPLLG
ncbi:MAG TPA: tripartite tricarboxylate transporter TctB family protein [Burkholderiales bacterium]|nr:tripartite tricarboxylate transporter TctB family protein [Burkholderiales bacterium]